MINQALQEFEGIPTEEVSLVNIVWRTLKGEGKGGKRRHKAYMDKLEAITAKDFKSDDKDTIQQIMGDERLNEMDRRVLCELHQPYLSQLYGDILSRKSPTTSNFDTASEPDDLGLGYCSEFDDDNRKIVSTEKTDKACILDLTKSGPYVKITDSKIVYSKHSRADLYYQLPGETKAQYGKRLTQLMDESLEHYVEEQKSVLS